MKLLIFIVLWWWTPSLYAQTDTICTAQDYSDSEREPNWECPSPGEESLVPKGPFHPSFGIEDGAHITTADGNQGFILSYDAVVIDTQKVTQLGMRIQALRKLRWLDIHKARERLNIDRAYAEKQLQIRLELTEAREKALRGDLKETRQQLNDAKKWYRSWTCGVVVGVVVTAVGAGLITLAVR